MLSANIESKVREILKSKGNGGWLRTSECAKLYANGNDSEETKFYRWRTQVEKNKVSGFQVVKLPDNISFIGLDSADPKALESSISEDKKTLQSIRSGLGLFDYLDRRTERKRAEEERQRKELLAQRDAYFLLLAKLRPEFKSGEDWVEAQRKARKMHELE